MIFVDELAKSQSLSPGEAQNNAPVASDPKQFPEAAPDAKSFIKVRHGTMSAKVQELHECPVLWGVLPRCIPKREKNEEGEDGSQSTEEPAVEEAVLPQSTVHVLFASA